MRQALFFEQGKEKRIKLITNQWGRSCYWPPKANVEFGTLTPANLDLTPCGKYIFIAFYPRESGKYCFVSRHSPRFNLSDVRCLESKDGILGQMKALNSKTLLAIVADYQWSQ